MRSRAVNNDQSRLDDKELNNDVEEAEIKLSSSSRRYDSVGENSSQMWVIAMLCLGIFFGVFLSLSINKSHAMLKEPIKGLLRNVQSAYRAHNVARKEYLRSYREAYLESILASRTEEMLHVAVPEIPVLNTTDSLPIFVHIPKTGGTSIEESLLQRGVKGGKHLDYSKHPYKVADVPCVPWHKPPVAFVKNSFAVVREPFSRLESEFEYCLRHSFEWCKNVSDDLNGYQNWIVDILEKYKEKYGIADCHLIPQWHYARWVTVKLPFSQLKKAEFWDRIRRYYNLTEITQLNEKKSHYDNGSYVDSLSLEVKRMVELHFREDFQFLSQFW